MNWINRLHLPTLALVAAALLLACVGPFSRAQEAAAPKAPETAQAPAEKADTPAKKDAPANGSSGGGGSTPKFDPAVVSAGQTAFERSCTKCHEASRSLERTNDLAGWRSIVRRMAGKRGAEVASGDIEPISVYLASRSAGGTETAGAGGTAAAGSGASADLKKENEGSSTSFFATISPLWRGGNNHIENPGFAPLTWVGAAWHGKVVSARVTLCIACHGVQEAGLTSRIEPVEAAVHVDASELLDKCFHGLKGGVDAGRFIVPFGAFSSQTDPSLYRTVSMPLIFNMGQRIFNSDLGFPVLPMPFANQGVDFQLGVPLGDCGTGPITMTGDGYIINGLQGTSTGIDYLLSRNLLDNNNRVAGGGRITVGDPYIRAGMSLSGGRFDDPTTSGLPQGIGLYYRIYGYDIQAHYKRLIRFQAEFARRDSDRFGTLPVGPVMFTESVYGYYVEAEARPWDKCKVSAIARYDWQRTSSALPPPGSTLTIGKFDVERFTTGFNIDCWRSSLLMVNYERWLVPIPNHRTADIFGVRYVITF